MHISQTAQEFSMTEERQGGNKIQLTSSTEILVSIFLIAPTT